jgi:multisubunit Na+/H+ antiporter MnhB subunit
MKNISDILGIIGVLLTLIAYFLLHINKIRPDKFVYPVLNSVGSALILYSIFFAWNISAFVMEICWLLISLLGVWKCYRKRSHV